MCFWIRYESSVTIKNDSVCSLLNNIKIILIINSTFNKRLGRVKNRFHSFSSRNLINLFWMFLKYVLSYNKINNTPDAKSVIGKRTLSNLTKESTLNVNVHTEERTTGTISLLGKWKRDDLSLLYEGNLTKLLWILVGSFYK